MSNQTNNQHGRTVVVAAVTTSTKRGGFPQNVELPAGVLPKDSVILGEQLLTIDKERLIRFRGALDSQTAQQLKGALRTMLDLK